jgi:phosphoglycerol transferase MdoB-like AlkP superfamily enzyme
LRINIISIIGAVIALIGLVLPWWTITYSVEPGIMIPTGTITSYSASIYTYQTTATSYGTTVTGQMNLWYGWAAFTLLMLGALVGIAFSLIPRARALLAIGGALALLSVIVFAAGLQNDLSTTSGLSGIGLLSSGTTSVLGVSYNYTTYLTFGFWLALVGAIVMLFASLRKPKTTAPTTTPPPPQPAQQEPSTTPL